jgi:hypothetical protein
MPSFTKDKAGKPKLTEKTENPDQAAEQASLTDKGPPTLATNTETK